MKLIVRVYGETPGAQGWTQVLAALTMMSDTPDFTAEFRCHRQGVVTHATVMAESGVERRLDTTEVGRTVMPLDLVSVRVTR